ncbi:MAG: response regulator, partial [Saprospiraceae bacterium]|nr:response regulator [Saprospiraceae bacterium]
MPKQIIYLSLFLASFLAAGNLYSQEYLSEISFYGTDVGLPHREINTIYKDKNGLMWVGTPQGIATFNGEEFVPVSHPEFSHKNIWKILEDNQGRFWLIPNWPYKDFDIWHPKTGALQTFSQIFGKELPINQEKHFKWFKDEKSGKIFVSGSQNELYFFEGDTVQKIELEGVSTINPILATEDLIYVICDQEYLRTFDFKGNFIQTLATGFNLDYYDPLQNRALPLVVFSGGKYEQKTTYFIDKVGHVKLLPDKLWNPVAFEMEDQNGDRSTFLLCGNSLHDSLGHKIISFQEGDNLSSNGIYRAFFTTGNRKIWIGDNFGLIEILLRKNNFKKIESDEEDLSVAIRGIKETENYLVVNKEITGTFVVNKKTGVSKVLPQSELGWGYFGLLSLGNDRVLIGRERSVEFFDCKDGKIQSFKSLHTPWSFFQLSATKILVGTTNGLFLLDLATSEMTPWGDEKMRQSLHQSLVYFMETSRDGDILIATNKGLIACDRNGIFKRHFNNGEDDQNQIPNTEVFHFYQQNDTLTWLATADHGLIGLNPKSPSPKSRYFNEQSGLPSNTVYAVYPDTDGNLWVNTANGVSKINIESGEVNSFFEDDGICNNEGNRIAHWQSENGTIYFGTIKGVTSFHPEDFKEKIIAAPFKVQIGAFQKLDPKQDRFIDLTGDFRKSRTITIEPEESVFTLQVDVLNYYKSTFNQVHYRLNGLDKEWTKSRDNTLRFGRLPYGEYTLEIKARDVRGNWSTNTMFIPITIVTPFYLRWWFIVGMIVMLGALVYGYVMYRTRLLLEKKIELEKQVASRTQKILEDKKVIEKQARELQSLESLKSRFFANVSHELRTPLSLMIGPLDAVLKEKDLNQGKTRKLLQFVQTNSNKLLGLVNEILDLSKLESGKLEVKEERVVLYDFIKPVYQQFSSFSSSESVKLELDFDLDRQLEILVDKGKLDKILQNFLSNAFKFTPIGKKVILKVERLEKDLHFTVTDEGPGIHPDDLPFIFDRFYQSKQASGMAKGGTGIGLSLSNELAGLMKGRLSVESPVENGQGSRFHLFLPCKVVENKEEIVVEQSTESTSLVGENDNDTTQPSKLLIVEDNPELRAYLQILLEDRFIIRTANNGKEALQLLQGGQYYPDIIISDLMMPEMDGITFLKIIKNENKFFQIPVLMLTARADKDVKIEALRIGVDDYLTKPFIEEELKIRLGNLLKFYEQRVQSTAEEREEKPNQEPAIASVSNV